MSTKYRNYTTKDKEQLTEMIFSLYAEDPEGQPIDKSKINKTIEVLSTYPEKGNIVVFENQGILVGYAILIKYWSNEYGGDIISFDELYVKPIYRKKGYATGFMKYIFSQYKNYAKAYMLEVTPSNTKAYNYYQRLGFKDTINKHVIKELNS